MRFAFVLVLTLFWSLAARAESVSEILQKQTQAYGGLRKLRGLTSYIIKADVDAGGMKGTTITYYKAPNKSRSDLNLPIMKYSQGCIGDDCWLTDNQGLTQTLGAELKGMIVTQSAIDDWDYLDLKHFSGDVTLTDTNQMISGTPCYVLTVVPKGGTPATICIDKTTYFTKQFSMNSDMGLVHTRMEDYRSVEGIMLPFATTEVTEAGFVAAINRVTSIELNVKVPDSLFHRLAEQPSLEYLGEGVDSVVVPFDLWRNHIFVKLYLNGKGPFDFIFDTGAGGTGVSKSVLGTLNLELLGATEARGVGGSDSSAVYRLDSLRLGEISLTELSAYAVDFGAIEVTGWRQIDGVVGYDFLSRFVVSVDYLNHQLIFYRKGTEPREFWGQKCPLTIDFRLPYTEATINDSISGRFRLDTGSHSTLDLNSPFVRAHQLIDKDSSKYQAVTAYGIGGSSSGLVGFLPSFELCHARLDSLFVNFSTTESGIFSGTATAGNIGAGILKGFLVTFDYNRESVYFQKTPVAEEISRVRNMAGVELNLVNDEVVVSNVAPGRAADGYLQAGDVIISIDDRGVKGKPIDAVNQMLIGERGAPVDLKVHRGNQFIRMQINLDSLY